MNGWMRALLGVICVLAMIGWWTLLAAMGSGVK